MVSPQPSSSVRTIRFSLAFAIATALLLALVGPGAGLAQVGSVGTDGKPADEGVWITLGSDAFNALQDESFTYGLRPVEARDERSGVVVTRVESRDLARLSELMHKRFNRCSGFLQHESLDTAEAALAQATDLSNSFASLVGFQIDQPDLVADLVAQLDDTQIRSTIDHLSTAYNNRYYLNTSGQQSALWIRDQWQAHATGRSDVTVTTYDHAGYVQPSVILEIAGNSLASEVVVLGAHLDSIQSGANNSDPATLAPGADDDASGIATLTEVIRVLLGNGFVPDRTIKFMGYAAEEVGLRGSGDIAADHATAGTDVVAVMQLDMTGFNGSVEDIVLIDDFTNVDLTSFVIDLVTEYQPALSWTYTTCGYACSDHASWTNNGFPSAFPFEARFGQHNPNIHTTGDTRANYGNAENHAMKFARIAAAFLAETGIDDGGGGGGQNAVYDAALGAPVCGTVGQLLRLASLLDGRANVGPRAQPAEHPRRCTDGTSGSYHSDESNDRIVVSTLGRHRLHRGRHGADRRHRVGLDDGVLDTLDLYYAADANSPVWVLIDSITPPAAAPRPCRPATPCPPAACRRVRANFRYQGSQSPCSGGNYDDADDLVFAVNSAGNTPPNVSITSPANGSSFTQGDNVSFAGTANDAEDGDISASLSWTSSLDGAIGSGCFVLDHRSVGGRPHDHRFGDRFRRRAGFRLDLHHGERADQRRTGGYDHRAGQRIELRRRHVGQLHRYCHRYGGRKHFRQPVVELFARRHHRLGRFVLHVDAVRGHPRHHRVGHRLGRRPWLRLDLADHQSGGRWRHLQRHQLHRLGRHDDGLLRHAGFRRQLPGARRRRLHLPRGQHLAPDDADVHHHRQHGGGVRLHVDVAG